MPFSLSAARRYQTDRKTATVHVECEIPSWRRLRVCHKLRVPVHALFISLVAARRSASGPSYFIFVTVYGTSEGPSTDLRHYKKMLGRLDGTPRASSVLRIIIIQCSLARAGRPGEPPNAAKSKRAARRGTTRRTPRCSSLHSA